MPRKLLFIPLLLVVFHLHATERFQINSPQIPGINQQDGGLDPTQFQQRYTRAVTPDAKQFKTAVLPVPSMDWTGGCVPTTVAMALIYWDLYMGFPDLIDNDVSNEGVSLANVAACASTEYYSDYYNPVDRAGEDTIPDMSEDENYSREDNCVADVLHTSRSADHLFAGGSWDNSPEELLPKWVESRNPNYEVKLVRQDITIRAVPGARAKLLEKAWGMIVSEIDAKRPVIAGINSTKGHVGIDHNSLIVGYVEQGDTRVLIINNTWSPQPIYAKFGDNYQVDVWGIGYITTMELVDTRIAQKEEYLAGIMYKFLNKDNGAYFFTANLAEIEDIMKTGAFQPMGAVCHIGTGAQEESPIFRFFNKVAGAHFYTASVAERDHIIATLSEHYRYEGVAFTGMTSTTLVTQDHSYGGYVGEQDGNANFDLYDYMPVYRCYLPKTSSHYFTADINEYNWIKTLDEKYIVAEGVAWYAKTILPHYWNTGEWVKV